VTVTRSVVLGCGSYLPQRTLTNADLAHVASVVADRVPDAIRRLGVTPDFAAGANCAAIIDCVGQKVRDAI